MKVKVTTINKEYIVDLLVLGQQTEQQRFQMFLEHFKLAGHYLTSPFEVIFYHTITSVSLFQEPITVHEPSKIEIPKATVKAGALPPKIKFKKVEV